MNLWRGRILDRVTADVLGNEFGGESFFAVTRAVGAASFHTFLDSR